MPWVVGMGVNVKKGMKALILLLALPLVAFGDSRCAHDA